MKIYHDIEDVFNNLPKTGTVGFFGCTQHNALKLHSGHASCIQHIANKYDTAIVIFFNVAHEINYLWGNNDHVLTCTDWVSDGVGDFCQENGADIVCYQSLGSVPSWYKYHKLEDMRSWCISFSDEYTKKAGIEIRPDGLSAWVSLFYKVCQDNGWSWDGTVKSWKDGFIRFVEKYFIEQNTSVTVDLIAPTMIDNTTVPIGVRVNKMPSEKINSLSVIGSEISKNPSLGKEAIAINADSKKGIGTQIDCVEKYENDLFVGNGNVLVDATIGVEDTSRQVIRLCYFFEGK